MIDLNNLGTSLFATGIGAALITQCKGIFNSLKQFFRFGYYIYTWSETNINAYYSLKNYIFKYNSFNVKLSDIVSNNSILNDLKDYYILEKNIK